VFKYTLKKGIDTDHPAFQVASPDYEEKPEDVFAERIIIQWNKRGQLTRNEAISIVKSEFMRMWKEQDSRDLDSYSYAKGISAVLAYINDSATPLIEMQAISYCYGLIGRAEESMDEIARRHGISKQAFSKKVDKILKTFNLKPQYGMRPSAQRTVYVSAHRTKWEIIDQDAPKS
jgi:hypothetical protein